MADSKTPKVEGSYFIRARASGNWYLWHQTYVDNKAVQKPIPVEAYESLGFQSHWPVIKAKAFCKELNKSKATEKQTIRKAASKAHEILSTNEDFFPEDLVKLFQEKLKRDNQGDDAHLARTVSVFKFIQKMMVKLKLKPAEYRDEQVSIYKYLASQKVSVNYAKRIISLTNLWGY